MAGERTLPGLGLTGFWTPGSNGWDVANDANLRLLSAVVNQKVKSKATDAPSITPTLGDIYIVPESATGDFAGQDNDLAIWDGASGSEAWVFVTPTGGWGFYVDDEGLNYQWNGSAWVEFAGAGGGGGAEVEVQTGNLVSRATINYAQTLTGAAWTALDFNTVDFDPNSIHSAADKGIKPNVAGYYWVHAFATFSSNAGQAAIAITKNLVPLGQGSNLPDEAWAVTASDLVYCNGTTDYVGAEVYNGGTRNVNAGAAQTAISVFGPVDKMTVPQEPHEMIVNGAMRIAQRGISVTGVTSVGYYAVDCFKFEPSNLGTWTVSQSTDAPASTEFTHSLRVECTTADATPAAADFLALYHVIEGQRAQGLRKGTANAKASVLEFWVKSDTTGTYVAEILDLDNNRISSHAYTVDVADTWERKQFAIPADTTGTLDDDTAASLQIFLWLGAGTDFTSGTLASAWAATVSANRAVGQTNLGATVGNYFATTGWQFKTGTVLTPFDHKNFNEYLADCLPYYQKSYDYGTAPGTVTNVGMVQFQATNTANFNSHGYSFLVPFVGPPSVTVYSNNSGASGKFYNRGGSADVNGAVEGIGQNNMSPYVNNASVTEGSQLRYHFVARYEL